MDTMPSALPLSSTLATASLGDAPAEAVNDTVTVLVHAAVLQVCRRAVRPQGCPPLAGAVVTVRSCRSQPPPQAAVHWPLGCHGDSSQSTGQSCPLQARLSTSLESAGALSPTTTTERLRIWKPPPHAALHTDQSLHALNWVSTDAVEMGHAPVLQAFVSTISPHAAPPAEGSATTVRIRDC